MARRTICCLCRAAVQLPRAPPLPPPLAPLPLAVPVASNASAPVDHNVDNDNDDPVMGPDDDRDPAEMPVQLTPEEGLLLLEEVANTPVPAARVAAAAAPAPVDPVVRCWVQLCDRTSPLYDELMVREWSDWFPYLVQRPVLDKGDRLRMLYVKDGAKTPPQQFGVYCVGVVAPDVPDVDVQQHMIIVNYGVVGEKQNSYNTLPVNGRLRSYPDKMRAHEWATADWVQRGFRVFYRWRVLQADDETARQQTENRPTSARGAELRHSTELACLRAWEFFLNSDDQQNWREKREAAALRVPAYNGRQQTTAAHWPCRRNANTTCGCVSGSSFTPMAAAMPKFRP